MIRANKLPEVLSRVLHDGIQGVVLMTSEGSIISSAFEDESKDKETLLAAITSTVWSNYNQGEYISVLH
jgi:predicted regulator of Ras-like GTPase activity (Roadblock/LC7/MglB family)